jgi:hypothetical protein
MNEDIMNSLNTLEKKKIMMSQEIRDNNPKIQEKLQEVLDRMGTYKRRLDPIRKLGNIDSEFIQKKVEGVNKAVNGVFNFYVRNLIVQTVNVSLVL